MNFFLKRWLSESASAHVPSRPRKLGIEHLEDRTVPAVTIPDVADVLPPVQTSNPTVVTPTTVTAPVPTSETAPDLIQNPIRVRQVIAAYGDGAGIEFKVSNDLGATWAVRPSGWQTPTPTSSTLLADPLLIQSGATPNNYTIAEAPAIAFDRADTFYLTHIQRNAANTSGVLLVDKYSIDAAGTITRLTAKDAGGNFVPVVLYRWVNQDPVFHPAIAVNNDIQTVTDPTTGAIQNNPTTGRGVYVAWNTSATQSTGVPAGWQINPTAVFLAVSDDGGVSFSDPVPVNGSGTVSGFTLNSPTAMNPQVKFTASQAGQTAGTGGSTVGGNLAVFYNTTPYAGDGAAVNGVAVDVSAPNAGTTANPIPITVQQTVNGQTGVVTGAVTPTGGVLTEQTTDFTANVNISTTGGFDVLKDMSVNLALYTQGLDQIRVELFAPNGLPSVVLLNSRQVLNGPAGAGTLQPRFPATGNTYSNTSAGDGSTPGLVGGDPSSIGLIRSGTTVLATPGLVFDQQAARYINDPANLDPYIMRVKPEDFNVDANGRLGLDKYNGFTAAQLSGTWTLRITNYKADDTGTPPPPPSSLRQFSLKFISRVNTAGFSADTKVGPIILGVLNPIVTAPNAPGLLGTATTALPLAAQGPNQIGGLQGWYSVAVDGTKGSFSPFEGRIYVAYTGDSGNDTNIYLTSSSDNGVTWTRPVQVNDDSTTDDFSEGNRAQFQPTVTVDPATGTVVVMWYDARWDASNARPATFIATSVNGGATFSPNTFLNFTKSAVDAIDRTTVKIEPVPNNLSAVPNFGTKQGLIAYDGTIVPLWTGNVNLAASATAPTAPAASLLTATTKYAAGPRILQGDMGPVADSFTSPGGGATTYNNVFSVDGTRQLNAFYVRFDRRVDPATFTPADVTLKYQDTTGAAAQDISGVVLSVTPLDTNSFGATRFLINLTPQTRVGTYSYAVGPTISDRIREALTANAAPVTTAATPTVTGTSPTYGITVSGVGNANGVTVNVRAGAGGPAAADIAFRLIAPDGTAYTLARGNGGGVAASTTFANTTFANGSPAMGATGPYGTVAPIDLLPTTFGGFNSANGSWQLQGVNLATGAALTPQPWSITFSLAAGGTQTFTAPVLPISYTAAPRITSTVSVAAAPVLSNSATAVEVSVKFSNAGTPAQSSDLLLRLTGPNNQTIFLTGGAGTGGFGTGTAGTVYAATTFLDGGTAQTGNGPFGYVAPIAQPAGRPATLQATYGGSNPNGTWTLQAFDMSSGSAATVQLDGWSLTLDGKVYHPTALYPVPIPGGSVFTDTAVAVNTPPIISTVSVVLNLSDPALNRANVTDLRVTLTGPNGNTVTLVNGTIAGTGTAGASFANTRFQDGAPTIAASPNPYSLVSAQSGVNDFATQFAGAGGDGIWTLTVTNLSTGKTVQLDRWALTFQGVTPGNLMDQNNNGTAGQSTATASDAFSNPAPTGTGGVPFTLPYRTDSLPLIIPGPRVVSSSPGLTADGAASYLDIVFDRDMRASSFTPAQVLEVRTPLGTSIGGPFTVTANPPGTDPRLAQRTFRVTFPPQVLSGHYSLLLAPGILSATGLAMDPNLNAG